MPRYARYIGIDYSGAATPEKPLTGLRVYVAGVRTQASEALPPGEKGRWTRRGLAEWLQEQLSGGAPALVGIDHGFSFPVAYFERHGLAHDWPAFLDDFQRHWPTDEVGSTVASVRGGTLGRGSARTGERTWKRLTEIRARAAKSVFLFGVQGSVAHSTHTGMPWLRQLRRSLGPKLHMWPFDGWTVPEGRSVVAEVYPSLWSRGFAIAGRTPDQHDAYSVAETLRHVDRCGDLVRLLEPELNDTERAVANVEGWILGVM